MLSNYLKFYLKNNWFYAIMSMLTYNCRCYALQPKPYLKFLLRAAIQSMGYFWQTKALKRQCKFNDIKERKIMKMKNLNRIIGQRISISLSILSWIVPNWTLETGKEIRNRKTYVLRITESILPILSQISKSIIRLYFPALHLSIISVSSKAKNHRLLKDFKVLHSIKSK